MPARTDWKARLVAVGRWGLKHSRALSLPFVLTIYAYLAYTLVRDWDTLGPLFRSARYGLLWLSVAVLVPAYAVVAGRWYVVLRRLGVRIGWWESLRIWFLSQAGRYLPGSIWPYVGRFYWGGAGIPADKMAMSVGLELLLRVSTETTLGAGLLLAAAATGTQSRISTVQAAGALALVLIGHIVLIAAGPRVLERLAPRTGKRSAQVAAVAEAMRLPGRLLGMWVYYAGSVIAVGFAFYLFAAAFHPLELAALPGVIGALAAATVIGFLVPIAPNGWGVREGVLVFLLSAFMPAPVATMVSIASRAWLALIEGLWVLSLVALARLLPEWGASPPLGGECDVAQEN